MTTVEPRWRTILLVACGLCYFAQSFQAWAWPALDGYPAIERWLDPGFLPTDFYTNTTSGKYGVDTWQGMLFGSVQKLTGVGYALQIAILTAVRCLLWPLAVYQFFKAFSRDELVALVGTLLGSAANFALPATLGWSWVWGDGSPAMFAAILATFSWAAFLERKAWLCFLLMAGAAIAQPLVAVHAGILIALTFFLDYSRQEQLEAIKSPANLACGVVFAAAFLSQYILLTPSAATRVPTPEYTRILAFERHPGDFLPSRFPQPRVIAAAVAAVAVLMMLAREWTRIRGRALLVGGLFTYAMICIAGWLFVEVHPIRFFVDLIPYRTVLVGAPLILLTIAWFATDLLRRRRWAALAPLALAALLASDYGVGLHLSPVIPAGLLLATAVLGWVFPRREGEALVPPVWLWPLAAAGLIAMAIPAAWVRRDWFVMPTPQNQHPLYAWAREHARGSKFLVEQFTTEKAYYDLITPQKMRLIGRAAVVASMDYPFADSDQRPWYRTWSVALDHGKKDFVETADPATLKAICKTLPYDYVVREHPLAPGSGFAEVASFPAYRGVGPIHVYSACADVPHQGRFA